MFNKKHLAPKINKASLILTDFSMLMVAIFVAYYVSTPNDFSLDIDEIQNSIMRLTLFILSAFIIIAWIWTVFRHYTYRKPFWDELYDIYSTLVKVALFNLSLLVFTNSNLSIMTWCYVWGFAFILVPFGRVCCKKTLKYFGLWELDCVIIGTAANAKAGYLALKSEADLGYKVCAFVDPEGRLPTLSAKKFYQTEQELLATIHNYQKVFIALENEQTHILESWVNKLNKVNYRNISIIPSLKGVPLYGAEISHFFSYETIVLRIQNNLAKRSSRLIKRTFDIIFSAIFLFLLSPFFLYLIYQIRKDGGNATYSQIRIGRNGKPFHCYKFRSMVMDSQKVLRDLLASDDAIRREWQRSFKLKNDPRVTQIGKFLRKTSLDELPQLWNVLKGDMSLVGPRPIIRSELRFYQDNVSYYYLVRPGLSGLWQVSGRSDTDYATRVYLDCWYVKNWSVWNDIIILAKTAGVVLKGKGAY